MQCMYVKMPQDATLFEQGAHENGEYKKWTKNVQYAHFDSDQTTLSQVLLYFWQ